MDYTSGIINDPDFHREPCLPAPTITVGNCNVWPYGGQAGGSGGVPTITTYPYYVTPVECSGEVHVFPCPHCDKCKCGQATVKRKKCVR